MLQLAYFRLVQKDKHQTYTLDPVITRSISTGGNFFSAVKSVDGNIVLSGNVWAFFAKRLVALISGHRDATTACFYELVSSSEMSAKIVHLLSDVMGFPKVVKREFARCKQCRNEDRHRRLCGKYTTSCRNECHHSNTLIYFLCNL